MSSFKSAGTVLVIVWISSGIFFKLGTGTPAMDTGRFACLLLMATLVFYKVIPTWCVKIILSASWLAIAFIGFIFDLFEFKVISISIVPLVIFGLLVLKGYIDPVPSEVEEKNSADFWKQGYWRRKFYVKKGGSKQDGFSMEKQ